MAHSALNQHNTLLINIDEIWLKGLNRPFYIKQLRKNIKTVVKAIHVAPYEHLVEGPKQILESEVPFSQLLLQRLLKIPGISSIDIAKRVNPEIQDIEDAVLQEMLSYPQSPSSENTFRITTLRSNKKFPMTSMDLSKHLGSHVLKHIPYLKVKMKGMNLEVKVRLLKKMALISSRRLKGLGGLPVGCSGHVVSLLSGGFDSPVASYLLSKRGVDQSFAFFYSYPFVGQEVKNKILELSKLLSQYQRRTFLYIFPFGKIQNAIAQKAPEAYRNVLFRLYMLKCSQLLAEQLGAQALVMGDSLAQVSSQTLENIAAIDGLIDLPIFRPLIGFNKREILDLSETIGTHDISVLPHDDACSLLAPKHPVTKASKRIIKSFEDESRTLMDPLIQDCLKNVEALYINTLGEIKPKNQYSTSTQPGNAHETQETI